MPESHILKAFLLVLILIINKKRKGWRNGSAAKSTGAPQSKARKRPTILPAGLEVHRASMLSILTQQKGHQNPGQLTTQPRPTEAGTGASQAKSMYCWGMETNRVLHHK